MNEVEELVARDAIRQLAERYAQYVDARDLDALAQLYVEQVRLSGGRQGRAALRDDFDRGLRGIGVSFLLVGNHTIEFQDDTHATGVVYCRGEIQDGGPDSQRFIVQAIQYHDDYLREQGRWLFLRRRHLLVYGAELGENPLDLEDANWPEHQTGRGTLPFELESWRRFWKSEPGRD